MLGWLGLFDRRKWWRDFGDGLRFWNDWRRDRFGLWRGSHWCSDGPALFRRRRRCRLFGLDWADQPIALGLATNTVSLSLFDGRRVALHTDPELNAEIEGLFVGEA